MGWRYDDIWFDNVWMWVTTLMLIALKNKITNYSCIKKFYEFYFSSPVFSWNYVDNTQIFFIFLFLKLKNHQKTTKPLGFHKTTFLIFGCLENQVGHPVHLFFCPRLLSFSDVKTVFFKIVIFFNKKKSFYCFLFVLFLKITHI